jgi:hypothetical protein
MPYSRAPPPPRVGASAQDEEEVEMEVEVEVEVEEEAFRWNRCLMRGTFFPRNIARIEFSFYHSPQRANYRFSWFKR